MKCPGRIPLLLLVLAGLGGPSGCGRGDVWTEIAKWQDGKTAAISLTYDDNSANQFRVAVPLMGIPVDNIIVLTFVLGSSLAALAGILFAISYPVLEPYMGALIGWKAFISAVVGGIGEIRGAFVGGFILGFTEIFVATIFPSTYRDLIAFGVLLLILTFRPTGIFGIARRTKV